MRFAIICATALVLSACSMAVENVTFTVTDKAVKQGKESSKYLIFTETGTFEITDSLLDMRFDSSDVYGRLKAGQTCTAQARGKRIELLSAYRNITEVQCQ